MCSYLHVVTALSASYSVITDSVQHKTHCEKFSLMTVQCLSELYRHELVLNPLCVGVCLCESPHLQNLPHILSKDDTCMLSVKTMSNLCSAVVCNQARKARHINIIRM